MRDVGLYGLALIAILRPRRHLLPLLVGAAGRGGAAAGGSVTASRPLATYAGWNTRAEAMGSPGLMTSGSPLFGSTWVFPKTEAERRAKNDPRKAIDERYASKQDYLEKVEGAARQLVTDRYLLEEDVERCVAVAGQKWDAFRGA